MHPTFYLQIYSVGHMVNNHILQEETNCYDFIYSANDQLLWGNSKLSSYSLPNQIPGHFQDIFQDHYTQSTRRKQHFFFFNVYVSIYIYIQLLNKTSVPHR